MGQHVQTMTMWLKLMVRKMVPWRLRRASSTRDRPISCSITSYRILPRLWSSWPSCDRLLSAVSKSLSYKVIWIWLHLCHCHASSGTGDPPAADEPNKVWQPKDELMYSVPLTELHPTQGQQHADVRVHTGSGRTRSSGQMRCRADAVQGVLKADLILGAEHQQRSGERGVALSQRQHLQPQGRGAGHLEALDARELGIEHYLRRARS